MGMRKMGINHVPEELIFTILSLLPAKSLLLCTAVCKLWQSIISNPKFINTHLANSQKKQTRFSVLTTREGFPHYSKEEEEESSVIILKLPPRSHFPGSTCSVGSCNGLLCLSNSLAAIIHVWNPSTKRLKMIPPPPKLIRVYEYYKSRLDFDPHFSFGFGYDSICNDYKILIVLGYSHQLVEAILYSSNADSWKEIEVPKTVINTMLCNLPKCVQLKDDGVLYIDGRLVLLSFDLHNEVFGVKPYPLHHIAKSNALKFGDSVAMIFESSGDGSVSLWILDDVCGSWTKKLNLDGAADWKRVRVPLILGVGQIVMREHVGGYFHDFYLYDYKKKNTKKILSGETSHVQRTVLDEYTDSLVYLEGFQNEAEFE